VKKLLMLAVAAGGIFAIPMIIAVAVIGLTTSAMACTQLAGSTLSSTAPVPPQARLWIALTHTACAQLPEPWVAAVMAQESDFRPDAYANDANGGTWGLFQLNAGIWEATYGAPWDADLNHNGIWDVKDPEIHAAVAGRYLCQRLTVVHKLLAAHPEWTATQDLTDLEALLIAHNAGESRLATYPSIPQITADFLRIVRVHAAAWSTSVTSTGPGDAGTSSVTLDPVCMSSLGSAGSVVVPPGTPADLAAAVRRSLDLVGTRSGFSDHCDRLACLAYGFANSGFYSASAHWVAMGRTGHAHPGDRCPPVGSFVFWSTRGPDGHVALVVQSDANCDPTRIQVVSNDVLDNWTGFDGGVYLVSLAQIESGFVSRAGYLGWSDPVCAGVPLPASAAA